MAAIAGPYAVRPSIEIPSVVRAAERYFAEVKTERRKSVTASPTRRRSSNLLPQSEVTAKLRQAERLQRAETRKMSRLSRRDQEPTGALRHTKKMKHVIRSH
jgi:hypothetical protein